MLGSCLPAGPTARRSRACRGPSRNAHLFLLPRRHELGAAGL